MEKKRIIAALVAVAFIVGMCTFLAGFLAGSATAAGTGSFLLNICKAMFPPTVVGLIVAYVVATLLDISTGLIKSLMLGTFTSSEMRKGLWKKGATVGIIGVTMLVNAVLYMMGLAVSVYLTIAVIGPLIAMEVGSIVENAGECGVPVPKILRSALKVLHDKGDQEFKEEKK